MGALLRAELGAIADDYPAAFDEPRGVGLMLGLPVRAPYKGADFVRNALDTGLFINAAGRNTLRFVPPLIISADEIRIAMQRLRATIGATLG
jgi:acetylornithine/succinyldiaminopimelate/putrescine aminotransferase